MATFDSTKLPLQDILADIVKGKIQLPDFSTWLGLGRQSYTQSAGQHRQVLSGWCRDVA